MLQTVMQLSNRSRTTSYSISFQPVRYSSTSTWGLWANALVARSKTASSSWQNPDPRPPSAKATRSITGKPMSRASATASSTDEAAELRGTFTPISVSRRTKLWRSSVSLIVWTGAPSTAMP